MLVYHVVPSLCDSDHSFYSSCWVLALVCCQLLIVSVKIVIVDVTEKARAYMVHLVCVTSA
jgi:hypothetical protein